MIKAVLFDIDGVLLDSLYANSRFFQDLLEHHGYERPPLEAFREVFHLTMIDIIKHFTKSTDEEEIQKIWEGGRDHIVPYQLDLVTTPEDSEKVIKLLRQEYTLGVVTSRTKPNIFKIPPMMRLQEHFSVAVGFEDVENHKPHPDPLLFAARALNIAPEEIVYIGDAHTDVLAAKAAGMKIIHFSKEGLPEVDAVTYSFAELPDIIKRL